VGGGGGEGSFETFSSPIQVAYQRMEVIVV